MAGIGEIVALAKGLGGSGGGSSGGVLVVNVTESSNVYTCDKTAGEMKTAFENGVLLIKQTEGDSYYEEPCLGFMYNGGYTFNSSSYAYTAQSESDYPSYTA